MPQLLRQCDAVRSWVRSGGQELQELEEELAVLLAASDAPTSFPFRASASVFRLLFLLPPTPFACVAQTLVAAPLVADLQISLLYRAAVYRRLPFPKSLDVGPAADSQQLLPRTDAGSRLRAPHRRRVALPLRR